MLGKGHEEPKRVHYYRDSLMGQYRDSLMGAEALGIPESMARKACPLALPPGLRLRLLPYPFQQARGGARAAVLHVMPHAVSFVRSRCAAPACREAERACAPCLP